MNTHLLEETKIAHPRFVSPTEATITKYRMTHSEEEAVLRGLKDKEMGKVSSQEEVEREIEALLWS